MVATYGIKRRLPLQPDTGPDGCTIPNTPKSQSRIELFFEHICREFGIELPCKDDTSPSKQLKSPGHDVVKHMKFLYFTDREALKHTLQDFRIEVSSLKNNDDKLNCLLEKLSITSTATKRSRTPHSRTIGQWPPTSSRGPFENELEAHDNDTAPPSPTMSIKHLPKDQFEELARYPALPTAGDTEPMNPFTSSAARKLFPPPAKSSHATNVANISFVTDTTKTSFSTNASSQQAEPGTPDTELDPYEWPQPIGMDGAMDEQPLHGTQHSHYEGPMSSMEREMEANAQMQWLRQQATTDARDQSSKDMRQPLLEIDSNQQVQVDDISRRQALETDMAGAAPARHQTIDEDLSYDFSSYQSTIAQALETSRKRRPEEDRPVAHGFAQTGVGREAENELIKRTPVSIGDSPSKETEPVSKSPPKHYRVEKMLEHGLSQIQLPTSFLSLPLDLRLEAHRVIQTGKIAADILDKEWCAPRTMKTLHEVADDHKLVFRRGRETDFSNATLCAKLRWRTESKGPLLHLELDTPRIELSNEFQRKYGSDRILCIDSDSPATSPKGFNRADVAKQFCQMILQVHALLGRYWAIFHIRDKKRKKGASSDGNATKPGEYEVFLFATHAVSSEEIPKISVTSLLDWALNFRDNADQLSGKLFSRLDLKSSRTVATIRLLREEVEEAEDDYSTNDADDTRFNNPNKMFLGKYEPGVVMADGTGVIAAWALHKVLQILGYDGMASVIQGRCAGAKGTWSVHPEDNAFLNDTQRPKILLKIAKSQIKILLGSNPDPAHFDLNVIRVNLAPKPSVLYSGFMPMLVDGGIPAEDICEYVAIRLQVFVESLEDAMKDRHKLRRWIHTQREVSENANRHLGIETAAGFPVQRTERIIQMLDAGFDPMKCRYLAEEILRFAKMIFALRTKHFKIPCPRSTVLMGIVDRGGRLGPGEIEVNFSTPFLDAETGQYHSSWEGKTALVTRNPVHRTPDIRKLRIVNTGSSNPKDVVIFSAKGWQPEAGKMSGGDYDGDTFWICVEPVLVDKFQNAPALRESDRPKPAELFITRDHTKVSDIITIPPKGSPFNETQVFQWLGKNIEKKLQRKYLPTAVLELEKQTYHGNNQNSPMAMALGNLVYYLIDQDKQCYEFDQDCWTQFCSKYNINTKLSKPAHRMLIGQGEDNNNDNNNNKFTGDWNKNSIVDLVYFGVLEDAAAKGLQVVRELVGNAEVHDKALTGYYDDRLERAHVGSAVRRELSALPMRFSEFREKVWLGGPINILKTKKTSEIVEHIQKCRQAFNDVQPINQSEAIDEWLEPRGQEDIVTWDLLKASAFMKKWKSFPQMVFSIVGDELCRLKAYSLSKTRVLPETTYLMLKPGKFAAFPDAYDDEDEYDEFAVDDSEFNAINISPQQPKRGMKAYAR